MTDRIGFDNERYLQEQSAAILERVGRFQTEAAPSSSAASSSGTTTPLHLPGPTPNVKLPQLLPEASRIQSGLLPAAASPGDIERRKIRADFGITSSGRAQASSTTSPMGIPVCSVVITRFNEQPAAKLFRNKLERRGIRVHTHRFTKGYPTEVDMIVSDEGYGANEYIETTKPIVVVTGPGPNSGKLATVPVASSTTITAAGRKPATPSSRPFRSGTCRSSIP